MSKEKKPNGFYIKTTAKNAHGILEHLAEILEFKMFGLSFGEDDTPVLRAAGYMHGGFNSLVLKEVRNSRGRLVAAERDIAIWSLSSFYNASPIRFKPHCVMSLDLFAQSLGGNDMLPKIEEMFCAELLDNMSRYLMHDGKWRIWNGFDWCEIDPWKFAVDVDLLCKEAE